MARPKVHHEERITTAVRIPKDLHERLRDAADERQISVNLLVVKALDDYLDRLIPVGELQLTR
jgi:predicted HicB family RNase H-like nuclease